MNINFLGKHILVEFYSCDPYVLSDHQNIESYMIQAAHLCQAQIVQSCFHKFNPWGVSGVVIIKESHLAIHTWPEYNYAAVDLFTCGSEVRPDEGIKYLGHVLKAEDWELREIRRGIKDRITQKI
ncbi:adenosylmethionine decarboxylase [Paenibacillus sp. NPDC057934]|uniref:adenosylmethionine decarboxylase n=1 Tax=Paenibacillus sp. NPDC057934 TaxID=3346282 RepID=UPI0036DA198D